MRHVIGIDSSQILACRIGVRNDNDLVWVGRAANHAAKLSNISDGYPNDITGQVFDRSKESSKYGGVPRRLMWEERSWTAMSGIRIFRSNWTWSL
jgi:class 3 adenylate cyclase